PFGNHRWELNGTWQGGGFTGLAGNTPITHTSWGFSTGGGLNLRLNEDFLVGLFCRYNWIDQEVNGAKVQYVSTGLGLTYNAAPRARPPRPPEPMPEPPPPAVKKKIVLRGVRFDFGKATIRSDARPVLDEAVRTLKQEGGISVIAEGYTDNKGSEEY